MTTDNLPVDEENPAKPAETEKPKPKVSPGRNIVGLVLLIALSAIASLEFLAKKGHDAAVVKLEKALAKEDGELLPEKEAEKLIGKAPDGPGVKTTGRTRKTYTWRGVFRKHVLKVDYTQGTLPALLSLPGAND